MAATGTEAMRRAASSEAPDADEIERMLTKVSLPKVADLKKMTKFEFPRCVLSDDDGYTLLWTAAVEGIPVTSIDLTRNSMGKRTAEILGQFLRFNNTIESIDLHDNEVDDAGAKAIGASFAFNHVLKTIRLSNNEMQQAGGNCIYDGVMCNLGLASVTLETSGATTTTGVPLAILKGLEPT